MPGGCCACGLNSEAATWAKANPAIIEGFLRAAATANELLATSEAEWQRIRPLMRVKDDATFEALKRHYREGIPERSPAENEADAKVLYQFLRELGGEKLVGAGMKLAPGTFWKNANEMKAEGMTPRLSTTSERLLLGSGQ